MAKRTKKTKAPITVEKDGLPFKCRNCRHESCTEFSRYPSTKIGAEVVHRHRVRCDQCQQPAMILIREGVSTGNVEQ